MTAIYLDGHATTPIAPKVLEEMFVQARHTGNPHASHSSGASASAVVETGRAQVAALINAEPTEIVFTSGATEANNVAILGLARSTRLSGSERRKIVTSTIEHPSVLGAAKLLERDGFQHIAVPVRNDGLIDLSSYLDALDGAAVVSIGLANGEIGTIQPVAELAAAAHKAGAIFHSDATQAVGRIPVDAFALNVDALSFSSHKMYGPPGIGALFISSAAPSRPLPLFAGGGQESGIRPGTVPAMLVAGFGAAAEIVAECLDRDAIHAEHLRQKFLEALGQHVGGWALTVKTDKRLPGSLNLLFENVEANALVDQLAGVVDVATGSACASGKIEPSHVLKSIGLSDDTARSAVRMYFHRYLDEEQVDRAAAAVGDAVKRFRLVAGEVLQ